MVNNTFAALSSIVRQRIMRLLKIRRTGERRERLIRRIDEFVADMTSGGRGWDDPEVVADKVHEIADHSIRASFDDQDGVRDFVDFAIPDAIVTFRCLDDLFIVNMQTAGRVGYGVSVAIDSTDERYDMLVAIFRQVKNDLLNGS